MKKTTIFILLLGLLLICSAVGDVGALDTPAEADFVDIDAYIGAQRKAGNIPGLAIGIVRNGEVVHTAGFGRASPKGMAVTAETPFIIGSVSKGFTALAIMQLVEEGKVELDAPVRTYLPWFTLADEQASAQITIRNLLNQDSGLGYNDGVRPLWDSPGEYTLEERIRQLSGLHPSRAPGTGFEYSNFNYMVLGLVVERVSGQDYGEYLQTRVFNPLGMEESTASGTLAIELASAHRWWFGFPFTVEAPYPSDAIPAGFIISSASDMAEYLGFQQIGREDILSREGLSEMQESCIPSGGCNQYCFGWAGGKLGDLDVLMHEGAAEGYYSVVALHPSSGWGLVVLSNANAMFIAPANTLAVNVLSNLVDGTPLTISQRFWKTYGLIDAVVLVLSGFLGWSITRLPRWGRKLAEKRPKGFRGWTGRVFLPIVSEFIVPFILWVFLPKGAGFPMWKVMGIFQPDLTAWLFVMAGLFTARGILRGVLAWQVYRKSK